MLTTCFEKVRFSVSSRNTSLLCNNKGNATIIRKRVAAEYSQIREYSPYLSLWYSKFFLKLSGIVQLKFCKDQSFWLTTVQRKTSTNFHKNACGESTVATLLLIEDSIKNFFREFCTNSFRGVTLATLIMLLLPPCSWFLPVSRFGKSSIVLKKISGGILSRTRHPFSSVLNLIRVIFQNSDEGHSFQILSTVKKIMLPFSALADDKKAYQPGRRKKNLMYISKAFIIRPYSLPVGLFDDVLL